MRASLSFSSLSLRRDVQQRAEQDVRAAIAGGDHVGLQVDRIGAFTLDREIVLQQRAVFVARPADRMPIRFPEPDGQGFVAGACRQFEHCIVLQQYAAVLRGEQAKPDGGGAQDRAIEHFAFQQPLGAAIVGDEALAVELDREEPQHDDDARHEPRHEGKAQRQCGRDRLPRIGVDEHPIGSGQLITGHEHAVLVTFDEAAEAVAERADAQRGSRRAAVAAVLVRRTQDDVALAIDDRERAAGGRVVQIAVKHVERQAAYIDGEQFSRRVDGGLNDADHGLAGEWIGVRRQPYGSSIRAQRNDGACVAKITDAAHRVADQSGCRMRFDECLGSLVFARP